MLFLMCIKKVCTCFSLIFFFSFLFFSFFLKKRANKQSAASAERVKTAKKHSSDSQSSVKKKQGHRPDLTITCEVTGCKPFEILYGLFKPPSRCTRRFANIDLVDLGVLMKDSLDNYYQQGLESDVVVYGMHVFGM